MKDLDLWVRLLHAHPVGFLPWATTVFWKHQGNTGARRTDFPEDLRQMVRKSELEAEGF